MAGEMIVNGGEINGDVCDCVSVSGSALMCGSDYDLIGMIGR